MNSHHQVSPEIALAGRAKSPFGWGNRLGRVAWGVVEGTLFRYSLRPMYGWRRWLLGLFGARLGRGVRVYRQATVWAPWNLEIGDHSVVADGVNLYSQGKISIGRGCTVSQGVHLCTGTHDYTTSAFTLYTKPIVIGDECWLAAQVFVHPGVVLPEGVVVGACSVVTGTLPAWTVCTGNPCKPLKPRIYSTPGGAAGQPSNP